MTTINHPSDISIGESVTVAEGEVIILPHEMHHLVDEAFERFQELCADLNLDAVTKENTWRTYLIVKQKFTLEVRICMELFYLNVWLCKNKN